MDQPTRGDAAGCRRHLSNRCLTTADTFRMQRRCHNRLVPLRSWRGAIQPSRADEPVGLPNEVITVLDDTPLLVFLVVRMMSWLKEPTPAERHDSVSYPRDGGST